MATQPLFDMSKAQPISPAADPSSAAVPAAPTATPSAVPAGQPSSAPQPLFDMSKAQPIESNNGQPEQGGFSLGNVAKGAGQEALGMVQGALTTVFPGQNEGIDALHELPAVYKAYEMARQQGKGMWDAVAAADEEAKRQEGARNIIKQRAEEFASNPDIATGKLLTDAVAILAGAKGFKGAAPAAEGAGAAEGVEAGAEAAAPKPGIIKSVLKGDKVVQPDIQETMKSVGNPSEPSIRETLSKPIEEARTSKESLYKAYDEAAGVDRKALQERLDNTQDQMSKLTGTPGDMKRLARLQEAEKGLKDTIADADSKAESAGIKITDADAANVKLRALEDVEKNVFKNQDVVKGNAGQGEKEYVDVDNAIKAIQKMKDNEKFGGPRWDQAFEIGSGDRILRQLREYRATGQKALQMQTFAKWVGRLAGAGVAIKGGESLLQ